MCKTIRRITACVCAVFAAAAVAVTASAEYLLPFTDCFLEGDYTGLSDSEVTMSRTVGSVNNLITITHSLTGNELDLDFWNVEGGTVSCEVYLDSDADVFVYMPAFASGWDWIDPTTQYTLVKGEWITVSESMQHFYDGFKRSAPFSILIQVRSTGNSDQDAKVIFRNFRINGVESAVTTTATTTTEATTTATTTTVTTTAPPDDEPVIATEEPAAPITEEVSAPVTEEAADPAKDPTEEAAAAATTQTTTAASTSAVTPPSTSTSIDYSQFLKEPDTTDLTNTIIIIVGVVVGVIALAAVGYFIYRKRKYY